MRLISLLSLPIFLTGLILIIACGNNEPSTAARVGNYTLTEAELSQAANPIQYFESWLEDHILAYEAERRGLADQGRVKVALHRVKVKLLVEGLIESELENSQLPSPREIEDYYQAHREDFKRASAEIEFLCFAGIDESALEDVRRQLRISGSEESIKAKYPGLSYHRDSIINPESLPKPLNELAGANAGEVIGPVEHGGKFYVFKVINIHSPLSAKSLSAVRDEIEYRIMIDRKMKLRERLVKELEKKYNPYINYKLLQALGLSSEE
ncbi:peptidyl-prolyl cis-trans isomerase [bacterium]|nr:peptidyl-prolyl cis-trans isomerase [bacterium]